MFRLMRPAQLTIDQLPSPHRGLSFEGGDVSLAEKDGQFYVIVDESTMASLLDEEDIRGMSLLNIIEFDSAAKRLAYLDQRFPGAVFGVGENGTL